MTESDPQLPEKIRQALKESPSLTPPESFYQGILRNIERKKTRVKEPAPWFWGYPAKALSAACVLIVMVLVTRETQKSKPELLQSTIESADKLSVNKNLPRTAPAPVTEAKEKTTDASDLADTKEVQDRLKRSISGFVGSPSPFEEVDEEAKKDLSGNLKDLSVPAMQRKTALRASSAARAAGSLETAETVQEWKGWISGIATFQTVVVKTPEEWQSLWRDHTGYAIPPPPPPDVDFSKDMVVGVFDGTKPTAGYSVDIVDVQTLPDNIIVLYRETNPAAGTVTAQILTQPYHLRLIPRSELPVLFKRSEVK